MVTSFVFLFLRYLNRYRYGLRYRSAELAASPNRYPNKPAKTLAHTSLPPACQTAVRDGGQACHAMTEFYRSRFLNNKATTACSTHVTPPDPIPVSGRGGDKPDYLIQYYFGIALLVHSAFLKGLHQFKLKKFLLLPISECEVYMTLIVLRVYGS